VCCGRRDESPTNDHGKEMTMIDKTRYRKPSAYLTCTDLAGPTPVVVAGFTEESFRGAETPVPFLKLKGQKNLRLNGNRMDAMLDLFGPDETQWAGVRILLVPGTTLYKGERVGTIFIKAVEQGQFRLDAEIRDGDTEPTDDIPF
jgi:hypothetical protein